jgi:hypothetical protein
MEAISLANGHLSGSKSGILAALSRELMLTIYKRPGHWLDRSNSR